VRYFGARTLIKRTAKSARRKKAARHFRENELFHGKQGTKKMTTAEDMQSTGKYSPKWQERFDFFETYGAPNDPRYKEAVKTLPDFKKKILINANVIAFFFGPIYLFVLGLWKKNLALIGIFLAINIVLSVIFAIIGMEFPRPLSMGLNIAMSMMYALMTNYAYYLKEIKGEQGWNPLKGMRL
jgi:hypothetical protein